MAVCMVYGCTYYRAGPKVPWSKRRNKIRLSSRLLAAPAPWPLARAGALWVKFGSKEIHQASEAQQRTDGPDERSLAARVPAAAQQLQSRLAGCGSEPGREAAV